MAPRIQLIGNENLVMLQSKLTYEFIRFDIVDVYRVGCKSYYADVMDMTYRRCVPLTTSPV
jgi:hypothetical protein